MVGNQFLRRDHRLPVRFGPSIPKRLVGNHRYSRFRKYSHNRIRGLRKKGLAGDPIKIYFHYRIKWWHCGWKIISNPTLSGRISFLSLRKFLKTILQTKMSPTTILGLLFVLRLIIKMSVLYKLCHRWKVGKIHENSFLTNGIFLNYDLKRLWLLF